MNIIKKINLGGRMRKEIVSKEYRIRLIGEEKRHKKINSIMKELFKKVEKEFWDCKPEYYIKGLVLPNFASGNLYGIDRKVKEEE